MTDNVPSSLDAAEGRHAGAAPYVLAFDTANEVIALGLGRLLAQGMPGEDAPTVDVVLSLEVEARRASNTQLLPRIDAALAAQGVEKSEIACVVCGRGPGSFTGVRIALATAKGMASALGVPLVGVSSLDAVAWGAWHAGVRGPVLVVADAMRKEVYPVRFAVSDAGIGRLEADRGREGRRGGRRAVCRSVRLPAGCGRRAAQVRGTVCAVRHAAAGADVGAHGPRPAAGAAGGMARRRSRSLRRAPARPCFRAARVHAPFRRRGERTSPSGEERPEEPDRRRARTSRPATARARRVRRVRQVPAPRRRLLAGARPCTMPPSSLRRPTPRASRTGLWTPHTSPRWPRWKPASWDPTPGTRPWWPTS